MKPAPYYIRAAGYSNAGYDPAVPNSRTGNGTQTGGYKLTVSRLAAGSTA